MRRPCKLLLQPPINGVYPHEGVHSMAHDNNSDLFDIPTFCESNKISRSLYYQLQKSGNGPRIMKVGGRTLITAEAVTEWRKKMEIKTEHEPNAS